MPRQLVQKFRRLRLDEDPDAEELKIPQDIAAQSLLNRELKEQRRQELAIRTAAKAARRQLHQQRTQASQQRKAFFRMKRLALGDEIAPISRNQRRRIQQQGEKTKKEIERRNRAKKELRETRQVDPKVMEEQENEGQNEEIIIE